MKKPTPKANLTEDFWANVKVVDAIEMVAIYPKKPDIEKAIPDDPEHCIYAECIRRVLPEARRIRIWRNVALVESRDKHGEIIALRYIISSTGRRALLNFDRGFGAPKRCSLLPPTISTKLDEKKVRQRRQTPEQKETKLKRAREVQAGKRKQAYSRKPTSHENALVRSGVGKQHRYNRD